MEQETFQLASCKVKILTGYTERFWMFFRGTISEPFLCLPERDIKELARLLKIAEESSKETNAN